MPPVILHLDQKQLSVIVNALEVHRLGRLQGIAYLFVCQMFIVLDNSPFGRAEFEAYTAFLKITHIC